MELRPERAFRPRLRDQRRPYPPDRRERGGVARRVKEESPGHARGRHQHAAERRTYHVGELHHRGIRGHGLRHFLFRGQPQYRSSHRRFEKRAEAGNKETDGVKPVKVEAAAPEQPGEEQHQAGPGGVGGQHHFALVGPVGERAQQRPEDHHRDHVHGHDQPEMELGAFPRLGKHPPGYGDGKELVADRGDHSAQEKPAEIREERKRVGPDLGHYFAHLTPFAAQSAFSSADHYLAACSRKLPALPTWLCWLH